MLKYLQDGKEGMQDGKNDDVKGKDIIERIIVRYKG